MGLTSGTVMALSALLAVVLFAGTVCLWPWLAGRTWRAVTGRVALLLATQLAIFVSVGLAANRAGGFYASWADLLGREQGQGVVVDHTASGASGSIRVLGTQQLGTQQGNVPGGSRPSVGGQIQKIGIVGGESHIATRAYVYLPPEYFQPRYRSRTFPAAVVLTGYPGTAESLIRNLRYPQTAYEQARNGRMQPMILVMLRPTVAPPRDTECVDVPGGPATETFFAEDLPNAVSGHYRVGRRPGGWGIIGASTGGYCALKIALHHPDAYAAGAGLSAHYRAPVDFTTGDLFHGDEELRKRADLMWYLDHMPAPRTSLLVTTSRHGEANYPATMRFIDRARSRPPTRISSITLGTGGHNVSTWRREIPPALVWLSGRLSAG
ncbi:alpha/beta hydrolase [Streptomyces jeddahensis]|uniref:Putative esterase n=1 Tax=Streptomyces jeddahensis TaxID=1716141 RepID=A0A177HLI0_9ACTN|nr:alpha/beta hydrolase-fold protein [Streptomyces jeddahensis]OAH11410.1 putative esterase [Streptomyces jeddahensis]